MTLFRLAVGISWAGGGHGGPPLLQLMRFGRGTVYTRTAGPGTAPRASVLWADRGPKMAWLRAGAVPSPDCGAVLRSEGQMFRKDAAFIDEYLHREPKALDF